jgi:hypothetical protein
MACGIQIYFFIFPLSPCSISDFHMYQRIEVGQEVFFFFFFFTNMFLRQLKIERLSSSLVNALLFDKYCTSTPIQRFSKSQVM